MLRPCLLVIFTLFTRSGAIFPDLKAESVQGDGEVLLKVTNVSERPLLIWEDSCTRNITMRLNDAEIVFPKPCNLSASNRYEQLSPGDFFLERRLITFPSGPAVINQSITLTYSRDGRTVAQRARHGQPVPGPVCRGIPCPPRPRFGTGRDDPLNPVNFPRLTVTLQAEPLKVTRP